jgi:succinate dehydrogenase / fumarate reductase cytochrome b subunit
MTHRITGNAMAMGAMLLFLWWLIAAATGPEAYTTFMSVATGWFGMLVGIGFTWTFFQHMCSGIRHLIMDTGQGFDLATSRVMAMGAFAAAIILTMVTWAIILSGKGF